MDLLRKERKKERTAEMKNHGVQVFLERDKKNHRKNLHDATLPVISGVHTPEH